MKKTLLIVSLLFLSVVFSQQEKTDKPNPMKGIKTKTESIYNFEEEFGEFKEILKGKTLQIDSSG